MEIIMKKLMIVGCLLCASPVRAATIEIILSPSVAQSAALIDRVEARQERDFRRYGNTNANLRDLDGQSRLARVAWAGSLIKDPASYGLQNLIQALATDSLVRSNKPEARVRFTINRMRIKNHPVARISGDSSAIFGSAELLDEKGAVLKSEKIIAYSSQLFGSGRNNMTGNYQFDEYDDTSRIGPAVARFIEKSLEKLYSGENFPGPELVVHGPGVRIIEHGF
jgi:hypothetical protein